MTIEFRELMTACPVPPLTSIDGEWAMEFPVWDFSLVFENEDRSMLFLGIDQHARQLAVSLRDQNGDVILARQVSTQPDKILDLFDPVLCASPDFLKPIRNSIKLKSNENGLIK